MYCLGGTELTIFNNQQSCRLFCTRPKHPRSQARLALRFMERNMCFDHCLAQFTRQRNRPRYMRNCCLTRNGRHIGIAAFTRQQSKQIG